MTVNPKKLRPYDQPPRRPLKLIPEGPDSPAIGFFVASALWVVLASALGALAIGLKLVNFEFSFPLYLFGWNFELDQRRVEAAFANATVFGWLSNAGFAAVAFMTPRLLGQRPVMVPLSMMALGIWNMSLLGGIAFLYVLDLGPNSLLGTLHWLFDGGLATGALIVTLVFFATAGVALRSAYVSLWFVAVALLALAGLTGLNALVGLLEWLISLPDLLVALSSVFVERGLVALWLLGMAYAVLHYLVPRATGQPLASGGIAMLTFLAWLALAPLSALGTLLDASVPFAITSLGQVATILLLVPASLAVVNLAQTISGRWSLLFAPGSAAVAAVALAFLLAVSLLDAIGSLRSVHTLVGGTDWTRGLFVWATYGTFTLAAFGFADHALPRLLRRSFRGELLGAAAMWLAFGGATIAGVALMGGGMAEGSLRAAGAAPEAIGSGVMLYRSVALAGIGLVALAALAFLLNLFLMYTAGRPAEYVVPGAAAPASAGH
jgi:cytochrome c oxidase cbb3-type subunit I